MKEIKFRNLYAEEIDIRVGQAIKSDKFEGVTLLLYKNARVDMDLLDEVCTPLGWKREHTRDNANCIVSIRNETTNEWVSKEDTGTESNTEAEKGLASSSFKRACTNWGIGRSLYTSPKIMVACKLNEKKQPMSGIGWYVKEIDYNDKNIISRLVIMETKYDKDTQIVFDWSLDKGQSYIKPKNSPANPDNSKPKNVSTEEQKAVRTQDKRSKIDVIKEMIDGTNLTLETVDSWVMKRFKKIDINSCTEEEFEKLKLGVLSVIGG